MSPFKRPESNVFYLDLRWRGYPRLKLSTDTVNKRRAEDMERTLVRLRQAGRRDILSLLADRRLRLPDVHDAYTRNPEELEQLRARAESPALGALVDRFLAWMSGPSGVSPRTRRRYGAGTVAQYRRSWNGFFATLPRGREATLADLTTGFLAAYRRDRVRATGGKARKLAPDRALAPATVNRDLGALGAFLSWCREVEQLTLSRPKIQREREPEGRMRWLSADELRRFEDECPPDAWPFFAVLFYTGARFGEAQGLRGGDILLHASRITVHESERRVKSQQAVRDLPIPAPLAQALAAQLTRVGPGPADLVFPEAENYGQVARLWKRVLSAAAIAPATMHDARHTFGVHASQAGVPIVRLQKLMGHATPAMTLRYMRHAPEAYLAEDGAKIAAHMGGRADQEAAARAEAARRGMGVA